MKTTIALLLSLLSIAAFGQGTAIRSDAGFGTNTTLRGATFKGAYTNSSGLITSGTVTHTNYTSGAYATESAVGLLFYPSNASPASPAININGSSGFIVATNLGGGGSGLSNLNASALASGTIPEGRLTAIATNQAAVSVLSLATNLTRTYQAISTNNNIAYVGFSGWDPAETSPAFASVLVTNTSGSLKTITMPAGVIGDTTIYVTNQSAFTVLRYPKMGTNCVARSLN